MKNKLLIVIGIIIIGVIIALTIGTLEYQTEFNQNCHDDNGKVTGFLQCMLIREDFAEPREEKMVNVDDKKEFEDDKTILDKFKDIPEVMAFYAKYNDAQYSVREDHISYFAGSDDADFIRMNVFFDDDKTLDHIETNCYFQKVHQYEIPQEDIVNIFEKYDCKK